MDLSAFPYLQGNYAPVAEERDLDETQLRVEGTVPAKLLGAYMRDGANVAFQPNHYVYPLDGDGRDASGNGLDGRVQGAAAASDRFGYLERALAFGGSGGRVEIRPRPEEPLVGERGFSVCVWVKAKAASRVMGVWSAFAGSEWLALERDADGRMVLRLWGNGGALASAAPLVAGKWAFVAVTFDAATNVARLWVNGALAAASDRLPGPRGWGRLVQLAQSPAGGLSGALDDVRLYGRPLSVAELEKLRQETREVDLE